MDLALFVAACCTIMGFALNITDRVQRRIKRRKKMMRKKKKSQAATWLFEKDITRS